MSVCSYRKRKGDVVDGVSKKQKKEEDEEKTKLEEQLKVFLFFKVSYLIELHITSTTPNKLCIYRIKAS